MEWRCEWCGKPHDENDPPCDNCGHGKFEKAVVRQTDLSEESDEQALVWVCTECGREHPKNSPPCSRCGNLSLEKRRQEIDESELVAPGYFELLTPQYLAAFGVALLLVVVFLLGVTGAVDIPGFGTGGVPEVEDVPGNATHSGSIPLASVESEFRTQLNDRQESTGQETLRSDDDLDEVSTYLNQKFVRSQYSPGAPAPEIEEQVREVANDACGRSRPVPSPQITIGPPGEDATAAALGEQLVEMYRTSQGPVEGSVLGVDIHETPDGGLSMVVVTC